MSDDETWIDCPGCRESVQIIRKRTVDPNETVCHDDHPYVVSSFITEHHIEVHTRYGGYRSTIMVLCPWSGTDVATEERGYEP